MKALIMVRFTMQTVYPEKFENILYYKYRVGYELITMFELILMV